MIIPVFNEAAGINETLRHVNNLDPRAELIVSDGASGGNTLKAVSLPGVVQVSSPCPCRGLQMNLGAEAASGDVFLFLHADARLPAGAFKKIEEVFRDKELAAGAFSLKIDSPHPLLRLISCTANLRVSLTGIPYGDQGIFIRRSFFSGIGRFRAIPLFEDVDLMRRIRRSGRKIALLKEEVSVSARRWERDGIVRTTLRNHLIRILYSAGSAPEKLARLYG
ncbi:MAG TPA: TIGR04283 family arsenosugar biosynthesis glycosyltransferase [bacterium]|nr:TIGR04283 family arsenosugar biosynthesis glycosyltransferase [bacterium]